MKETMTMLDTASASVFQRALGAEFFHLAPEVKALHASEGKFRYSGSSSIERGQHPLARLCGWIAGLPPAGKDVITTVDFEVLHQRETWARTFGGAKMTSHLWLHERRLCERLGPLELRFQLHRLEQDLHWHVERVRLFGVLPLPARWFDEVQCREFEQDGRYHFDVEARMPLMGLVVRYAGWLEPA